jgi:RNA polymerase sigma-70 factor, ECF subfamily
LLQNRCLPQTSQRRDDLVGDAALRHAAKCTGASALLLFSVNEKQLVEDLRESAFRRHYAQVYRYIRRRTGSDEEAEEIAQIVFVDAAARLHHFRPGATPVLAWLYTVAQRRLADRARQLQRRNETIASLDAARLVPLEEARYGPNLARALREAVERLPQRQREVLVMKLLEGRPFAEIARRLEATEAACKMRFARALEALREELEKEGIEP